MGLRTRMSQVVSSGGINGQFPSSLEQFLISSGQFLVTLVLLVFISFQQPNQAKN